MNETRRAFLSKAALAAGAAAGLGGRATAAVPKGIVSKRGGRPNFVVFLTDDQGYGDLGCMGAADLKTPNIDALAKDGARFTSWYSNSPVCSPSRAALLTGRYPGNAGVRKILGGPPDTPGLPTSTPTLAEALKPLGYHTGLFGKWHLGAKKEHRPEHRGFDETFNFLAGCVDYYSHVFYWGMAGGKQDPFHDLWENGKETWEDGRYLTELIAERATNFVSNAAQSDEPFFMYVAFNAPHYPMHAPKKYLDRFPNLPWERRIMAAMLAAVDDGVGQVVDELKKQGLYDNTCILYTSDNGPSRETRNWMDGNRTPYPGGSAGGLSGHKFSLFEGGIRVPGILSWPDRIKQGTVINDPAASMDIFPTFLSAAGGDPGGCQIDGIDLMPALANGQTWPQRPIFWEYQGQTAVREGKWKLVLNGKIDEDPSPDKTANLADLETDPREIRNLAKDQPAVVQQLTGMTLDWYKKIEARTF